MCAVAEQYRFAIDPPVRLPVAIHAAWLNASPRNGDDEMRRPENGSLPARSSRTIDADVLVFTVRERDVLRLLVEGAGDGEIGHTLGIRRKTVSEHVSRLLKKTGLPNRVALAVFAVRNGVV